MASITGLGKIGLPRLSENMDPDDARALRNCGMSWTVQSCFPAAGFKINR